MTQSTRPTVSAWLLSILRPFWRGVGLSMLLGALTIVSSLSLMMTSAWLISKCALQPSIADLGVSIVAVRFFGIARAGFRYLERLVSHDTTFRILARLRVTFYQAIEPLAPARLSRFQTGDLLGRVVADVESLQEIYLRAIAPPVVALVTAIGVTVLFAAFNWLTALTMAMFLLLTGFGLPVLVQHASQSAGQNLIAARAAMNAALVDQIQGLAELLAYGAEETQARRLNELSQRAANQQMRFNGVESLSAGAMVVLINGAALAVLISAMGRVDGIYLAGLVLGVFAAFEALMPLSQAAQQWSASTSAARRLIEIRDQPPAVVDPVQPAASPITFDLKISNLRFRYSPERQPIFDPLDLTIPHGEKIAILGRSGSGKSTLVNLLARFWEYTEGSITIGGVELKDLPQAEVHKLIAVLAQQAYYFNTTIMENIRLARPDATDEEVMTAARQARLDNVILTRQDLIGENGATLSGGERRRIALARTLLTQAPITILDEPTAYLDAPTERAILETIFTALEGRTLILLTHRATLLERCDHVYRF